MDYTIPGLEAVGEALYILIMLSYETACVPHLSRLNLLKSTVPVLGWVFSASRAVCRSTIYLTHQAATCCCFTKS